MRLLWLIFTVHTALAQVGFGKSYLRNSRLCHEWSCINTKLGLPDSLPPLEQTAAVFKSLLPEGAWHQTLDTALSVCYGHRDRRYTNTCPGQALLHCLMDQFIENCPEESLRKDDACSPVTSLPGLKYMFSQSIYENMEANLATERRPSWFLKSYFKSKCCHIPAFANSTMLSQCGFGKFLEYHTHAPQNITTYPKAVSSVPAHTSSNENKLHVVSLKDTTEPPKDTTDPLDCCDMKEFIKPTWRSECDFEMSWDEQSRLSIVPKPIAVTVAPTTPKPVRERDVMILPRSCEQETCVFKKLNIVSDSGSVDLDAFLKLLDNFTDHQPPWTKAKARVVTTCLSKPLAYDADCDINKVLACTFDVLTENCPQSKKVNLCKHSKDNRVCQISSSKYRPKHRRDTCYLPEIVNKEVLIQCGINSLTQVKQAAEIPTITKKKNNLMIKYACKDHTPSTQCLMGKMGILNKYGFMDYFKMKDLVRQLSGSEDWKPWVHVYLGAFMNIPMYREYCSSPKKMLNVLDSMLMTCPISRIKATPQCAKIFSEMTHSVPIRQENVTKERIDQILNHFHHVFWPVPTNVPHLPPKPRYKIVKKPIYDYGIMKTKNAPKVQIINVKPLVKKPLVLLPVYMRLPAQNQLLRPFPNDGVMRDPFWLHKKIAQAHLNSTAVAPKTANPTNPTIPDTEFDFQKILP